MKQAQKLFEKSVSTVELFPDADPDKENLDLKIQYFNSGYNFEHNITNKVPRQPVLQIKR